MKTSPINKIPAQHITLSLLSLRMLQFPECTNRVLLQTAPTKLLEDVVDDCDSAGYVRTLCHTQDVVDPLLFTTPGEEHVIPKEAIKGVVSNITVVDNETIQIVEREYFLLLALLNGSTDTTSCNEAGEEPFTVNHFGEQVDEDSMSTDVGRPQRK